MVTEYLKLCGQIIYFSLIKSVRVLHRSRHSLKYDKIIHMTDMTDKKGELLSDEFVSKGVRRNLEDLLPRVQADINRGAKDQADEGLRRALSLNAQLLTGQLYEPSNNLNDDENLRYKALLRKRFTIRKDGSVYENYLNDDELREYERLESKAENRPYNRPPMGEKRKPSGNPFK